MGLQRDIFEVTTYFVVTFLLFIFNFFSTPCSSSSEENQQNERHVFLETFFFTSWPKDKKKNMLLTSSYLWGKSHFSSAPCLSIHSSFTGGGGITGVGWTGRHELTPELCTAPHRRHPKHALAAGLWQRHTQRRGMSCEPRFLLLLLLNPRFRVSTRFRTLLGPSKTQ